MTPPPPALDGRWLGLRSLQRDEAPAPAAADLIGLLDTIELPFVILRRDLVVAGFNKAAGNVLGLLSADVGRGAREVRVLAEVPGLEEACARILAGDVESRADARIEDRWFVVRVAPYATGHGDVSGFLLTFTNVTAFRASIDQAIYEREFTKAVLNTVADPLVVLSADQRIQSANRAFYRMFAVSRDDSQGAPLHQLGSGCLERAGLGTQLSEMLAGSHPFRPLELDYCSTAEGVRTLVLDARPLVLAGRSERSILATFHDITARKRAEAAKDLRSEEELRRSEAFLAEAQRLSSTGSFSWRVPTGEITWSEQLCRIFDFDPAEVVTLDRISSRVHPQDVAQWNQLVDRARDGAGDLEGEHRLLMPDQSVKHLHLIAHGTRDRDGRLEYIGAVQDVTQRRLSEEALGRVRSELAQVARIASLGELTASIAHEVSQPLAGIVTNASTCLRMLGGDPPNLEGARETAQRMIRDGHRASDVITRLRSLFARAEPTAEPMDLNEATAEVIALSLSDLQQSRVVLRTELAERLPAVNGDRVQLQQVILNLLRNAADAMRDVDDRPRQLLVRTESADRAVVLSVRDAGTGIVPGTIERLFDAFFTTKSGGMGIGLAISRTIVESHQGRLWAAPNEDGPGATFAFSVPCDA